VGTYRKKGARWIVAAGGVRLRRGRDLKVRSFLDATMDTFGIV
jgi:hypothetical protein